MDLDLSKMSEQGVYVDGNGADGKARMSQIHERINPDEIRLLIRVRVALVREQFTQNQPQQRGDAPMALHASAFPRELFYRGSRILDPDPKRWRSSRSGNF
jgi:hypothetical protein